MKMYLTKVWGFEVPCGPLQFGKDGWRDRARAILFPGDLVVLVGTKGPETLEHDRGRLLGMMEPTTEPVMSQDFELATVPEHFKEGHYKWPFALLNRRAWRMIDQPLLEKISSRRFSMEAASGIVELTDDERDRILQLVRDEVELLTSLRVQTRLEGAEVARRRGAPPPTTTRSGVMHLRNAPAYTYAMEIQGATSSAFKIGWAFNHKARAREFNLYALPKLGGLSYQIRLTELWDTARQAFQMERELLQRFDKLRHPMNSEVVCGASIEELKSTWSACVRILRHAR